MTINQAKTDEAKKDNKSFEAISLYFKLSKENLTDLPSWPDFSFIEIDSNNLVSLVVERVAVIVAIVVNQYPGITIGPMRSSVRTRRGGFFTSNSQ